MGYEAERQAIEARFQTLWVNGGNPRTVVVYQNQGMLDVENERIWARFTVLPTDSTVAGISSGSHLYRFDGFIVVQLFGRPGIGSRPVLKEADAAVEIFKDQSFAAGTGGTVICDTPVVQERGPDGEGWYQVNVSIPYHRHQF